MVEMAFKTGTLLLGIMTGIVPTIAIDDAVRTAPHQKNRITMISIPYNVFSFSSFFFPFMPLHARDIDDQSSPLTALLTFSAK